jgi:hypothetical protein
MAKLKDAARAKGNGKGTLKLVGSRGSEVLQMAANALSFLVGIVLPLGGAIWLLMH